MTAWQKPDEVNRQIGRWAALAAAARAEDRIKELAQDLVAHYLDRSATLKGKAMMVCMERENCVRLYEALVALAWLSRSQDYHDRQSVEDPPEWSQKGYLTTKGAARSHQATHDRPGRPAQDGYCLRYVADWHRYSLPAYPVCRQADGRPQHDPGYLAVNRVFRDKPHGLVVDYIGIGDALREATSHYTQGGGEGEVAAGIDEKARPLFFQALDDVQAILPKEQGLWRTGVAWPRLSWKTSILWFMASWLPKMSAAMISFKLKPAFLCFPACHAPG